MVSNQISSGFAFTWEVVLNTALRYRARCDRHSTSREIFRYSPSFVQSKVWNNPVITTAGIRGMCQGITELCCSGGKLSKMYNIRRQYGKLNAFSVIRNVFRWCSCMKFDRSLNENGWLQNMLLELGWLLQCFYLLSKYIGILVLGFAKCQTFENLNLVKDIHFNNSLTLFGFYVDKRQRI